MITSNKQIINLRSVFCGYQEQHAKYLKSAQDFLKSNKPGIFVIGGTNLTGKTNLIKQIKNEGGLNEYDFFENAKNPPPERCYVEKLLGFSDEDGKPRKITPDDIYGTELGTLKLIPVAIEKGIKTVFLPEVWAGHKQALELVRDELIRKHGFKVVIDAVSSGEGSGFFDGEANNRYIQEQLSHIFSPDELHLYTLDFNRNALFEGVRYLSQQELFPFERGIAIFPKEQRETLIKARDSHNLELVLTQMLGLPINPVDPERI